MCLRLFFFSCVVYELLLLTCLCMISLRGLIHTISVSNFMFIIYFFIYSSRWNSSKTIFVFNITIGCNAFILIKQIGTTAILFLCYFNTPSFFKATKNHLINEFIHWFMVYSNITNTIETRVNL